MHAQHTADDNTAICDKTYGWEAHDEMRWILHRCRGAEARGGMEKEIIEKFASHPRDVGEIDFRSFFLHPTQPTTMLCSPLPPRCVLPVSFGVLSILIFIETKIQVIWKMFIEGEKITKKQSLNSSTQAKALIDKTSEKLITCKIQFDVTLFCRCVNSRFRSRISLFINTHDIIQFRYFRRCRNDIELLGAGGFVRCLRRLMRMIGGRVYEMNVAAFTHLLGCYLFV